MGKRYFGLKIVVVIVLAGCFSFAFSNSVGAEAMPGGSLYKLGIMRGVKKCYNYAIGNVKKIDFDDKYNKLDAVFNFGIYSKVVNIPTNIGNNLDQTAINCKKVFEAFGNFYTLPDNLEGFGYEKDSENGGVANNGDSVTISLDSIVDNSGQNGKPITFSSNSITCYGEQKTKTSWGSKKRYWAVDYCTGEINAIYDKKSLLSIKAINATTGSPDKFFVSTETEDVTNGSLFYTYEMPGAQLTVKLEQVSSYKKTEPFSLSEAIEKKNGLKDEIEKFFELAAGIVYTTPSVTVNISKPAAGEGSSEDMYRLKNNSSELAAATMLNGVGIDSSLPTKNDVGGLPMYYWSSAAEYSLYYHYLISKEGISIGECSRERPSSAYAFKNQISQWCVVNVPANVDLSTPISVVSNNGDLGEGNYYDILEWFNKEANYTGLAESDFANGSISDQGDYIPGGTSDGSVDPCWESGIDSVAWVMCPIESNLKTFASKFTGLIDSWLQVDTDLYKTGGGAHIAWGYIRTIANTIMIIFMGVIIFSQLTGYGIDNYGIKKLLPKFILMAVVINLSFFLCQIIIDLSNILGNGIQGLLYGVGNQILAANGGDAALMNNFIDAVTATIYTASTLGPTALTAGVTIAATAGSGGTILGVMLVLLMLVTVVAAIIMFFVSLGARMVIIMVCLIMAPLALACYILPNTKDTFKKWKDAFKAAIIIYPICGFTIGVSYIIKAIALGPSMPFLMIVVSGIVPFLPFFMIPAMLKGAISTLGAAGNALSTMGNTFKSGAGKLAGGTSDMIKNSDRYKIASRLRAEMNTRKRAGIDESGQPTARGKRRIARSLKRPSEARLEAARIAAAKKSVETNEEANSALTNAYAKFGIAEKGGDAVAYYGSQLDAALSKKDKEESLTAINSVLAAASSSGYLQDKQVAKILRDRQQAMETKFGKGSETLSTWMRDTNTKYGKGFLATDFEMKHWMQNGGKGGVEALGKNYGDYTRNVLKAPGSDAWTDYKAEDGARLSSDSLLGMAREGIINTSMAASMLDMHKNYSPDKKVMLNAIMNGAIVADTQAFKQDVMNALKTDGSGNYVGGTIGGVAFTGEQIKEWTAARPQDVNVVNGPTEISIPHGPYGGALAGSPRNPNPNPNSSKTEFKRTEKFE